MRGRMVSFSVIPKSRRQLLTIEVDGDIGALVDALRDVDIDFQMKKWRHGRSLDANAYLWVLLDKLAEKLPVSKTEIYREEIREIGGNSSIVCVREHAMDMVCRGWQRNGLGWITEPFPSKFTGCMNVILYEGSSAYDTAQMSRLIDAVVEDCRSLGIETMPPAELASLKEAWR